MKDADNTLDLTKLRAVAEANVTGWEYLATFDPPTVLRMIEELERRDTNPIYKENARLREALDYYADDKRWPAVAPSPLVARAALTPKQESKE